MGTPGTPGAKRNEREQSHQLEGSRFGAYRTRPRDSLCHECDLKSC